MKEQNTEQKGHQKTQFRKGGRQDRAVGRDAALHTDKRQNKQKTTDQTADIGCRMCLKEQRLISDHQESDQCTGQVIAEDHSVSVILRCSEKTQGDCHRRAADHGQKQKYTVR